MKMKTRKIEKIHRIDFNLDTREIIEVYEISPDGCKVRTDKGWVPAHQKRTITQRPPHVPGFLTEDQILFAIQVERDILKDKKYKDTAAYIVASRFPIKDWLKEGSS